MIEKIKYIILGALISIIAIPSITLSSSFVSSLIQGKTIEEAVQILAEQTDVLIGRVTLIENKQSSLEKKVYCSELIRLTPNGGSMQWINIDITGFYQNSLERLETQRIIADVRPGEQQAEIDFWQEIINEAKPLYDNYIEKCGDI